jgi:hypothetical protein
MVTFVKDQRRKDPELLLLNGGDDFMVITVITPCVSVGIPSLCLWGGGLHKGAAVCDFCPGNLDLLNHLSDPHHQHPSLSAHVQGNEWDRNTGIDPPAAFMKLLRPDAMVSPSHLTVPQHQLLTATTHQSASGWTMLLRSNV